jgi:hypothetical protein
MPFWDQFSLQLVTPIVGTVLIGGTAALITRKYQDRRLDREIRMGLVTRVSDVISAIHTELSFYERWVRHSQPSKHDHEVRRAEVDKSFLENRIRVTALQTEIDAYFGAASEPKILFHRLTDLAMLRYAIILELPNSQVVEIIDHLGRPGHSGFSVEELHAFMNMPKQPDTQIWPPIAEIEKAFTKALVATVDALLTTPPIATFGGFNSGKLLTAFDQRG